MSFKGCEMSFKFLPGVQTSPRCSEMDDDVETEA